MEITHEESIENPDYIWRDSIACYIWENILYINDCDIKKARNKRFKVKKCDYSNEEFSVIKDLAYNIDKSNLAIIEGIINSKRKSMSLSDEHITRMEKEYLKEIYYDLRKLTPLDKETEDIVKELYSSYDIDNIKIAIEIMRTKLKEYGN